MYSNVLWPGRRHADEEKRWRLRSLGVRSEDHTGKKHIDEFPRPSLLIASFWLPGGWVQIENTTTYLSTGSGEAQTHAYQETLQPFLEMTTDVPLPFA